MRKQSGFSFIEILVALAILGLGIVAIMALFPVGMNAERRSEIYTMASLIAEKYATIYQSQGWRESYALGDYDWISAGEEYPGFEYKLNFSDGPSSDDSTDVLEIRVRMQDDNDTFIFGTVNYLQQYSPY